VVATTMECVSPTALVLLTGLVVVSLLTHLTGSLYVALALTALIPAGRYYWSIRTHPFTKCRRCGGAATHRDPVMPWAIRECYSCLGLPGRRIRWGARVFTAYGKTAHQEAVRKRRNGRAAIKSKR
jgi:hypothetical protein